MEIDNPKNINKCPDCRIFKGFCYCDQLSLFDNQTRIDLIIHHREKSLATNTAFLAARILKNSTVHLRGLPEGHLEGSPILKEGHASFYLFPDENAIPLTPEFVSDLNKPVQLIIPDGSWKQAKKFKRRMNLENIPSVTLAKAPKSVYPLRKQTKDNHLCTLEAISYALLALEGIDCFNHMMNGLKIMVEKVLYSKKGTLAPKMANFVHTRP